MRFDNQSSSLRLLGLAIGSTKFNPRRVLITLLLILLVAIGSVYIANQIYQHQTLKPPLTDKTVPAKNTEKQSVSASQSSVSPQLRSELQQLRQRHKRKKISQLKSKLQTSALGRPKRNTPRGRWLSGLSERLERHKSILSHADETAKLQLQDQQLYSEEDFSSPPSDEEEPLPPPPKQEPGFWSELGKEFFSVFKDIVNMVL